MHNLYFDNAATSFPKPKEVAEAIYDYTLNCGGTYSRGAYPRAQEATRMVEECRDAVASLLGASDSERIIFTSGATMAANMLLRGVDLKDCHILVSPLEHNAIMRPLNYLCRECGVTWSVLPHFEDGRVNIEKLSTVSKDGVELIIMNHVSNLNGVIQPIAEIKKWAGDIPVAIDASQSAGHHDISVEHDNIDYLIFTGHKGLMGITGSGGLYIKKGMVKPLIMGGTSTQSHLMEMPTSMPDSMEAGTPPMVAISALNAALKVETTPLHTHTDIWNSITTLRESGKYRVLSANNEENQSDLFSIIHNKISNSELAYLLYDKYQIECRSGMLCSPLAHQTLDTTNQGVVRLSFSPYNSSQDIEYLTKSLLEI